VPVVDDPAGIDEPCHVEDSVFSGLDDCALGAICLHVDDETLTGICTPLCTGSASNPVCEDPTRYCPAHTDGAVIFCVPLCNPLALDCPDGQVCVPDSDAWTCVPDASGAAGGYGDPCASVDACDPGSYA